MLLQNLRPGGQRRVDDHEPEGDQWHKVVELVGSVHDHTQHQHQEVETKEDLQRKKGDELSFCKWGLDGGGACSYRATNTLT